MPQKIILQMICTILGLESGYNFRLYERIHKSFTFQISFEISTRKTFGRSLHLITCTISSPALHYPASILILLLWWILKIGWNNVLIYDRCDFLNPRVTRPYFFFSFPCPFCVFFLYFLQGKLMFSAFCYYMKTRN